MVKLLVHWITATLAILVAAYIVQGISVTYPGAAIAAVVLGALNLFVKPVISILTLPINIITLGLFSLVINALLVMVTAYIVPGFVVAGFWPAFFFALVLMVINWVFHFWSKPL